MPQQLIITLYALHYLLYGILPKVTRLETPQVAINYAMNEYVQHWIHLLHGKLMLLRLM